MWAISVQLVVGMVHKELLVEINHKEKEMSDDKEPEAVVLHRADIARQVGGLVGIVVLLDLADTPLVVLDNPVEVDCIGVVLGKGVEALP